MSGHRRRRTAAIVTSVALLLVACGNSDAADRSGAATTTIESSTTTTSTTTTTGESAPSVDTGAAEAATLGDAVPDELAESEEGHTALVEVALGLLIVAEDLDGQSFADAGYVPTEGPNRCGVDVDAEHPAAVLVGAALLDDDDRHLTEELRVYDDVALAADAFEAHRGALSCGEAAGERPGDGVRFGAATDVNAVVGADAASEVTVVEDAHRSGVVITALVGDVVLTVELTGPDEVAATLDPREVAAFAVGKVLAALEAG